jgi:glycosyltransferase involved in cell wall biosynthesis
VTDILVLSLGTTLGLRASDESLARLIREAGASVEVVAVRLGATARLRRAYPVIDLVEAAAARRALGQALARVAPRAVIFSSTTSSLLAPHPGVPYAVRLDSPARLNRPGARNLLQHRLERRRLRDARLVLPLSDAAAAALPRDAAPTVVLHDPIAPSPARRERAAREPLVVAYTPDPKAKGLDIVVGAWARAELAGAYPDEHGGPRLEVFGIEPDRGRRHLARHHLPEPRGLRWRGGAAPAEFRAALRRAHVFLTGARWEDYGRTQLEALSEGALLVCAGTGGPFEALAHARELAPTLCAPDLRAGSLARALRAAFELSQVEVERYRRLAARRIEAYLPEVLREVIAERVLPALLD